MASRSRINLSRVGLSRAARSSVGRLTGRLVRSLGGSAWVQSSGRFLRRNLWAWPVVAALALGLIGWWVQSSVGAAMRDGRAAELQTILDADATALRIWLSQQERVAELLAADERMRGLVAKLAQAESRAAAARELQARLKPRLDQYGYQGFFLVSPAAVVLASDQEMALNRSLEGYRKEFFDKALATGPSVSKPYRSGLLLADEAGQLRVHTPTMLVSAPVKDEAGKPLAILSLRMAPEAEFTRILQVARVGETGETYAIDREGRFLSQSRFDDVLKQIGLLVDLPDSRSILTLEARDPGADMTEGDRPKARRPQQPLTKAASEVVQGHAGLDADGYRDYRGVPVVGAWKWLDDLDIGLVTEIDCAEAFRAAAILGTAIWALMGLLTLAAVGIFLAMILISRQQRLLQRAAIEAKQLGQYTLLDKLGSGGMGTVYRARHAMLRRPTAVKLLDADQISEAAATRFEREVQLTAALTHPNTIAVYDYGRTPEGVFYYAMELLDGCNLDELVGRAGPLPEARAVHLLAQMCGSLAEAHAEGLAHRDVKPANVFVCRRGGMFDFVKVLDFGLVKAVGRGDEAGVTSAGTVTGTPLYMPPEAVNDPEKVGPASDVYAIGAVAYFLLTGTAVFSGSGLVEILMKHVRELPETPSARVRRPVAPDLEALVMRCLAKSPGDRPADAGRLLRELQACRVAGRWTADDAAAWWNGHVAAALAPSRSALDVTTAGPVPALADVTADVVRPPS